VKKLVRVSDRFPVRFAEAHPDGFAVVGVVILNAETGELQLRHERWTCEQVWAQVLAFTDAGRLDAAAAILESYGFARRARAEVLS
jgi:hypothetical protein